MNSSIFIPKRPVENFVEKIVPSRGGVTVLRPAKNAPSV